MKQIAIALLLLLAGCGGLILAAQEPQACPTSISSSGDVLPPVLVKKVIPQYPEVAEVRGMDGLVTMSIVIAPDGSVKDIKVTHGLPQFIPNAVNTLGQWQYRPARVDGVAIACRTFASINFQIAPTAALAEAENAATRVGAPIPAPFDTAGVRPTLPPPPNGVLRVSSKVMEAQMEKRVGPVYPADAAVLDAHGVVFVLLTVSTSGEVSDAQVLTGPQRFREAALSAVKQWKFKPYEVAGEPRGVQIMISLNFAPRQ